MKVIRRETDDDMFVGISYKYDHRKTQAQKNANNYRYYREQADLLDHKSFSSERTVGFGGVSEYKRQKVNYDLFNNIINLKDLAYVCQPFGADGASLPATMTNRDIVSPKIKVLLGMEMNMPFSWKAVAVNREATTRKEQEETERIKQYVTNEIMKPIEMGIRKQKAQQSAGRQLTPQEQQQIEAEVQQELQAQTPDEVRKYMVREHQDPAEALARQLLEYLSQKLDLKNKFNKGFKHLALSAKEVYHVGIFNNEPKVTTVNSLYFDSDGSPDNDGIEDNEWATCEYRMSPSDVISKFGTELDDSDIDKIYTHFGDHPSHGSALENADFTFDSERLIDPYTIRVMHMTWKGLCKVGFLTYFDKQGQVQEKLVDENYRLNKDGGDIYLEWEWVPETHEVWKIMSDIYVYGRPVPGQYKSLTNLWECKLPYYGVICDNLNSPATSPMDRMKGYQYYYDIIYYRMEMLMASDKGKMLAMNIGSIPKSAGLDIKKFLYYMEANKIIFVNPSEEGNRGNSGEVTNTVKEVDMSLVSQIKNYIDLAEYIETKCGASIGVTRPMEGAVGPTEAVTNTKQNIVQASHIVKPFFELHNTVKGRVLNALLNTAKVAYAGRNGEKLSYVLDDMSMKVLQLDTNLLENSEYGLFVSNSSQAEEAKQVILGLAQAAMQNQQVDLSDVIKVVKSNDINEADELLQAGQAKKAEQLQQNEREKMQSQKEQFDAQQEHERAGWEHEAAMILLKAREDRKTKIQVEAMAAMGFDPNKDEDGDGEPDVLEVAKFGVDADIKREKLQQDAEKLGLDKDKFAHQQKMDKEKLKNEKEKIDVQRINKNSAK